jgi:plastocyanin
MKISLSALLLVLVLAAACAEPASSPNRPASMAGSLAAAQSSPLSATMRFGNDTVGSNFPTPSGHDQSGHARDNLIPRTVVIDQGGTVTFELAGRVHQVGIFADGTKVEDVIRTGAQNKPGCPAAPQAKFISGAANPTTFVAVTGDPLCDNTKPDVAIQSYTFADPGKYLVICMFIPHLDLGMYGWVVVRDR